MMATENKCLAAAFKNMRYSEYIRRVNNKNTIRGRLNDLEELTPDKILLGLKFSDRMHSKFLPIFPKILLHIKKYK